MPLIAPDRGPAVHRSRLPPRVPGHITAATQNDHSGPEASRAHQPSATVHNRSRASALPAVVTLREERPNCERSEHANSESVRIVAAFTGDVAQHDAALRLRLRHPGRPVVESRQQSPSDLRRVREEIERTLEQQATHRGSLLSVNAASGAIAVARWRALPARAGRPPGRPEPRRTGQAGPRLACLVRAVLPP